MKKLENPWTTPIILTVLIKDSQDNRPFLVNDPSSPRVSYAWFPIPSSTDFTTNTTELPHKPPRREDSIFAVTKCTGLIAATTKPLIDASQFNR